MNVGILGLGIFLPEDVRTNDWWPERIVDQWVATNLENRKRIEDSITSAPTEGQKRALRAVLETMSDPFRGIRERRVLARGMKSSDMETAAARAAIADAGIDPKEIDLITTASLMVDDLTVPNCFAVHNALGLTDRCLPLGVESCCNSFILQIEMARDMVSSGRARYALLIQSCGNSPVLPVEDPQGAWFGDGASAVIVGPVGEDRGFLATSTRVDTSLRKAVAVGAPGRGWHEGPSVLYSPDRAAAFRIILGFPDYGKEALDDVFAFSGIDRERVDFFACHQAQVWQRKVVQDFARLNAAKSVDTFSWAGNLGSSNLPLVLHTARREGLLHDGDLVALMGGGAGVTWSAMLARWGK